MYGFPHMRKMMNYWSVKCVFSNPEVQSDNHSVAILCSCLLPGGNPAVHPRPMSIIIIVITIQSFAAITEIHMDESKWKIDDTLLKLLKAIPKH